MRGKPLSSGMGFGLCRITPADAGKTRSARENFLCKQDHPRGCGENYEIALDTGDVRGSPPRMRGKPAAAPRKLRNTRITPADAGKTLTAPHKGLSGLDHPRRCGENN